MTAIRSPRPVKTTEIRAWRAQRLAGMIVREIGAAAGRSHRSVEHHVGRLRHSAFVPALHQHGVCLDALERMLGITPREAVALIRAAELRP